LEETRLRRADEQGESARWNYHSAALDSVHWPRILNALLVPHTSYKHVFKADALLETDFSKYELLQNWKKRNVLTLK